MDVVGKAVAGNPWCGLTVKTQRSFSGGFSCRNFRADGDHDPQCATGNWAGLNMDEATRRAWAESFCDEIERVAAMTDEEQIAYANYEPGT